MTVDDEPLTDIRLEGVPRLARGAVRDVYPHPARADRLIKTFRTRKRQAFDARRGPVAALRRRFTLGLEMGILREYRAYLRAARRAAALGCPLPVAAVGEVVFTDRGLGQVVERITDGAGGLPQRLRAMIAEEGLDDGALAALNAFAAAILEIGVSAPDLGPDNIVWDGARARFVLIDGFGEKTFVPVREWLPALNRRRVEQRLANIGVEAGLVWDAGARRFRRQ